MTINEYQDWTSTLWLSGRTEKGISLAAIGLAGEVGEALEVVKKHLRDGKFDREKFVKEMGDAQYYIAQLANQFDVKMSEILDANVQKLEDRKSRNVLHGAGDNR